MDEHDNDTADSRNANLRQFSKRRSRTANFKGQRYRQRVADVAASVHRTQRPSSSHTQSRTDNDTQHAGRAAASTSGSLNTHDRSDMRDDADNHERPNDAHGGNSDSDTGNVRRDDGNEPNVQGGNDQRECFNCHRRHVHLTRVQRHEISSHRSCCTFHLATIRRNSAVTLCDECTQCLCGIGSDPDDWRIIWPAFMWTFLTDASHNSVCTLMGGEFAWQFVPALWRPWWIGSLRELYPRWYHIPAITLTHPVPHFEDVTNDVDRFHEMLDNLNLGEIKRVCNELNFPTILCPWGCSTFPQDIGRLPLSTVFHHVLRKDRVKVHMTARARSMLCNCLSMRGDYLDPDHPRHICSKHFIVRPCIAFHRTLGMRILTCKDHNGGTIKRYLHVPKSLLGLPSQLGDQLAQCVIQHRTVKPMIAKKYSNTYQLAMQRGSFAGIDLCCLKSTGDFRSQSAILHESESLSIAGREDIRALLDQLQRDGHIPTATADGFATASSLQYPDGPASHRAKYASGSTFITFIDCMKLQKHLATVHEITVNVRKRNAWQTVTFTPGWIRSIVWVHPCDEYGALFHAIPNVFTRTECGGRDVRLLFVLMAATTTLPLLWDNLAVNVKTESDWPGFFLTYASKSVIYYYRTTRKSDDDPFTEARGYKAARIFDKLRAPPSFDACQLLPLLREFTDRRFAEFWEYNDFFHPRDPNMFLDVSDVRQHHNIFCCARARRYIERNGRCLPASFPADETQFELRFVVMENEQNEVVLYARHGGQFAKWFTTKEKDPEYMYMADDDTLFSSGAWTFAIYVNTKPDDIDQLRREFLSYTGGQTIAVCAAHDVPLIVVRAEPSDSPWRCPGLSEDAPCGQKIYYSCPKRDCHRCLCKKCLDSISAHEVRRIDRERIARQPRRGARAAPDPAQDNRNDDDGGSIHDEDYDDNDDDGGDERNQQNQSKSENNHVAAIDGEPSDDDILGLPFIHDLHDGTDEPIFDLELEEDPSEPAVPELPRTVAHANAIADVVNDARSDIIGNVVLLNGLGSLLVRRRHNMNFSRANMEFLQRNIVSKFGYSIPLLYAEATIFPSIFPYDCGRDSSILGAIPSAFLSQEKNSTAHGIASLKDHSRNRLFLAGVGTASDFRYQTFLFDAMVNGNCSAEDSRVVLNRGVAESNTPAGLKTRSKDDHFFSDSVDNRQMVLNLTEAQKYHPNNLFLTITANQKETFGLSPIKNYLDSGEGIDEIEQKIGRKLDPKERKEYERALYDASCTLMTRCWLKIRYIIMTYIMHSFEEPLRKLIVIFWRDEYQEDAGNLSHVHALLQVEVDRMNAAELRQFQDVIRGFNADIVRVEEIDDFQARGIFESKNDWYDIMELGRTILTHKTRRNMKRTGTGDDDVARRDVDFAYITPDRTEHCALRIDPGHSPEVVRQLAECGLCDPPPPSDPSRFEGEHELLRCERHIPPVRRGDSNMSPVNGSIFCAMHSMMNLQEVGGYSVNRYVTKYITKIDQNSHTVCNANARDGTQVSAKSTFLHNTKIASSAHNEQKRINEQRDKTHPKGRTIARPEIVQLLSGDAQVHTNLEFKKVDTTPLEDRAGLHKVAERKRRRWDPEEEQFLRRYQRMTGNNTLIFVVMCDYVRHEMSFPRSRMFTPNQVMLINDNFSSEVTVSQITVFSVRPPELRELFPFVTQYFRWFIRQKSEGGNKLEAMRLRLNTALEKCEWVDGFGYTVKLRTAALDEVRAYMVTAVPTLRRQPDREMVDLINEIIRLHDGVSIPVNRLRNRPGNGVLLLRERWTERRDLFLHDNTSTAHVQSHHPKQQHLPIPVHSCVKPTHTTKFLFHILLSMGQLETELDLLGHATLRESFLYAALIDDTNQASLATSVTFLIRLYVLQQLVYYPISTKQWGNYLLQAARALRTAIIDGDIAIDDMPACLYTRLRAEVIDKTKARIEKLFHSTVTAAYAELETSLQACANPVTLPELLAKRRVFDGQLRRTQQQTEASYAEQEIVRLLIRQSFAEYTDPTRTTLAKSVLVAGGPGNGKTHCLMYAALYYSTGGRLIVPCAILAERAMSIGGEHFHRLFHFPITKSTSQRLAELAVIQILRRPESVELLLAIDALALDESGTMSSTIFSAMDIIMRRVRGVSAYMGGMMIITTIDDKQLKPVVGYPLLLSPHVATCFRVVILTESVRSADDPLQQRVIEISRYSDTETRENVGCIDEAIRIISNECNFVDSFDDESIPPTTLRVFARQEPVHDAMNQFYAKIEQQHSRPGGVGLLRRKFSHDTQIAVESHGRHDPAAPHICRKLDHDTKEPSKLLFFRGAIFQFTFNDPADTFTQSRLAFMLDVPSQVELDNWRPLSVFAAPPGAKSAPQHTIQRHELLHNGWTEVTVGPAPEYVHTYDRHGIRAQRHQYGLRPHISATIHGIQGATMLAIATSIEYHKKEFRLWEKAQWLVIVSRTNYLSQIFFVGNKHQTLEMIRFILEKRSQFSEYTEHVLRTAAGLQSDAPTFRQHLHPYRARDQPLPRDTTGFSYLLVSAKTWALSYIGETNNLHRRLKEHNSNQGASETRNQGPWVLVAYVVGFDSCKRSRLHFQDDWQNVSNSRMRTAIRRNQGMPSIQTAITTAQDLISGQLNHFHSRAYHNKTLRLVIHADIQRNSTQNL